MKPTLRRNGKHMVTVKATHHIDSDTIASILAKAVEADIDDDGQLILPRLSRAAAEQMIRRFLADHGNEGWWMWEDALDADEVGERGRWAAATVRRLWPALDDDDLARFEKPYTKNAG